MSEALTGRNGEPRITEFGPLRVIGMRYAGKNENEEIKALWGGEAGFITRSKEVDAISGDGRSFGLCRCIPGVTDGSFEYIAAVPVADNAPVPAGMVETTIGAGTYVIFPVPSLNELTQVWESTWDWLQSHPEWDSRCNQNHCECAEYPSFEMYPADFTPDGKLYLYLPVKKA